MPDAYMLLIILIGLAFIFAISTMFAALLEVLLDKFDRFRK